MVERARVTAEVVRGAGFARNLLLGLVCLYFFFEYGRPQDYVPELAPLRIPFIVTASLLLLWVAAGDKSVLADRLIVAKIAFIVLSALGVFYAANRYWPYANAQILISYLVAVLALTSALHTRERALGFIRFWVLLHLFVAFGALRNEGVGSGSFLGDENDMALTLALALPFAYFLAQYASRTFWERLFWVAAAVMLAAAIVETDSRGGFLGLMAAVLATIWFSPHRVRNLTLLAILGVALYVVFVPQEYGKAVQSITDDEDSTRVQRLYYWDRGFAMFLDHPVLGVGSGNYPWRVGEYDRPYPERPRTRSTSGRAAHSLYFQLIPEYGLVGIALFSGIVVALWRRLRLLRERFRTADESALYGVALGATCGLVAFLVSGAFISVLYYPHFWYLLGFIVVLSRLPTGEPGAADGTPARSRPVLRGVLAKGPR